MKTQNNSDRQTVRYLKIDENKKVQFRSNELMV